MKRSTRAAFFSGLIFPGAGCFYLGFKYRGYIYAVITIVFVVLIVRDIHFKTEIMVNNIIKSKNFDIQMSELIEQVQLVPGLYSAKEYLAIYLSLAFIWCTSIIDSYRLGKK